MFTEEICFSHKANKHEVTKKWFLFGKKFTLTEEREIWDWDNCTVGTAISLDNKSIVVIKRKDVENNRFTFENIYSDNHQLEDDNVHGDKENAPEHIIKYYFVNYNHPVVFINTSNHAMSEHDTNHHLWNWEYISWVKGAPFKVGNKTRKEIDQLFKPLFK